MGRHRKSIRLDGYDYSEFGAYFVTVCAFDRACLFGEIENATICLTDAGEVVREEWLATILHRPYVRLIEDQFVVMPNHLHGIVWIVGTADGAVETVATTGPQRRRTPAAPTAASANVAPGSLGAIVRAFKSATTRRINHLRGMPGAPVWQRNYYEHIIRSEAALHSIREYIAANPANWSDDTENPARRSDRLRP